MLSNIIKRKAPLVAPPEAAADETGVQRRRYSRVKGSRAPGLRNVLLLSALLTLVAPGVAWAIPSPDLIINLSASIAQLAGLLSVVLGGFFVASGRKSGEEGTEGQPSKARKWLFRGVVVLLFISVTANALQYAAQVDEKNSRLQTNLHRTSTEAGNQVGDTSLKTLSFSDQGSHQLGMSTDELAQWIEQGKQIHLIDVRELEEVESGQIAGAENIRYPDLKLDPGQLNADVKTVLMCYSGNRSSELCEAFASDGMSCQFVVGGYEKWMAEGRPLGDGDAKDREELRALPDFPNKGVLLETKTVMDMVTNEKAAFIDVRYPADFELGHLPGAINLPIRRMTSADLDVALKALPDQPYIAACYDRRSCFYAQIAGLRLSRMGLDYRGRYTVPHEYFVPRQEKAFVQEWLEVQQGKTLFGMLSNSLGMALAWLHTQSGHHVLAIVLLVVVLRLLLAPFAWKADRDQRVQRGLAPKLEELKQQFGKNRAGYSRAVLRLHRENGMTPMTNLVGALVQLGLFLAFFNVVGDAAKGWNESFLWMTQPAQPDPTYVLPALVTGLFLAFLLVSIRRKSKLVLTLCVLGSAAIGALTLFLAAAVNLYLIVNLGLMLGQLGLFALVARRNSKQHVDVIDQRRARRSTAAVVALADALDAERVGQKALRLGRMLRAGLPVPDGFVLTSDVLSLGRDQEGFALESAHMSDVDRQWSRLGSKMVAVRSSGRNEDGANASYAGVFDSILNVERENFVGAIASVRASLNSEISASYNGSQVEHGAVLVQPMVPAEFAGVLFTEHPASAGCSLVEMVRGLGEDLVSGKVTPDQYRFGRRSGVPLDSGKPPVDLEPLLELGRRIEALFGGPQDIEWAYAGGKFIVLQARDITAAAVDGASDAAHIENERRRLLELIPADVPTEEPVLVQNELSELLPHPTRLSSSLMERLWQVDGSTDIACRMLGIPYDVDETSTPYVTTVFGALYVNRFEERRRLGQGPGFGAAFRLARAAESIEADFREGFLPGFQREMKLRSAVDVRKLDAAALVALIGKWADDFVTKTYVQAELVNLATDFYWKTACQKLEAADIDPAVYLGQMPETVVSRAMSILRMHNDGPAYVREFLDLFGHRAPEDYELSQPRYSESPELLIRQASRLGPAKRTDVRYTPDLPADPLLRLVVDRACRFQVLKEEAKHHCMRQLAEIRRVVVELDRRLKLNGGLFNLSLDEVTALRAPFDRSRLKQIIAEREAQTKSWRKVRLPGELSVLDLERYDRTGSGKSTNTSRELQGTRVAGEGEIVGRVQVLHDPNDIGDLEEGAIVVARFTDPSWYPAFPLAGGVVTEVGGWLSHAAIVARECNVTAIVGVSGATDVLRTGQTVRLCTDGRVEVISEAPAVEVAAAS